MQVSSLSSLDNLFYSPSVVKSWNEAVEIEDKQTLVTLESLELTSEEIEAEVAKTSEKVNHFMNAKSNLSKEANKKQKALEKAARIEKNKLRKAQEAANPKTSGPSISGKTIRVSDSQELLSIRFSQDTIDPLSSDNLDLRQEIYSKGWRKNTSIKVAEMPDGKKTSLDNRRLYAIKLIVRESASFFRGKNPVEILPVLHTDSSKNIASDVKRLESKVQNAKLIKPALGYAEYNLSANSYGALINCRVLLGNGNAKENPYGFTADPLIRDSRQKAS